MDQSSKCPKCGGTLEEGFICTRTPGGWGSAIAWYPGLLERSFWTEVKTIGKAHYQVRTYRCNQCGFLESYAAETDLSAGQTTGWVLRAAKRFHSRRKGSIGG